MSDLQEISPAELVRDVLVRLGWTGLQWAVVVGPASDAQQQAGVASVVAAGLPNVERYLPLQWLRAQVRCLAGTLSDADVIAQTVKRDLDFQHRVIARQASTDQRYLVHLSTVTAGPSMHFDSPETWETLLFGEILVSTEPL